MFLLFVPFSDLKYDTHIWKNNGYGMNNGQRKNPTWTEFCDGTKEEQESTSHRNTRIACDLISRLTTNQPTNDY